MELSTIKKIIADLFRCQTSVVAVLLYGSYANGTATPDSDVDIGVLYLSSQIPTSLQLWELEEKLSVALSCDVDLVCLNNIDPIFGNQIYKNHQVIVLNDPSQLHNYFVHLGSEYAEVKELIRPMEDQILQRKYYE